MFLTGVFLFPGLGDEQIPGSVLKGRSVGTMGVQMLRRRRVGNLAKQAELIVTLIVWSFQNG